MTKIMHASEAAKMAKEIEEKCTAIASAFSPNRRIQAKCLTTGKDLPAYIAVRFVVSADFQRITFCTRIMFDDTKDIKWTTEKLVGIAAFCEAVSDDFVAQGYLLVEDTDDNPVNGTLYKRADGSWVPDDTAGVQYGTDIKRFYNNFAPIQEFYEEPPF